SLPPRYDFLDPTHRIRPFAAPGDEYRDADAAVVLDTGTWNQLGDFGPLLKSLAVPKCVIDHHLTQDDLGGFRLVAPTAAAAARPTRSCTAATTRRPAPCRRTARTSSTTRAAWPASRWRCS